MRYLTTVFRFAIISFGVLCFISASNIGVFADRPTENADDPFDGDSHGKNSAGTDPFGEKPARRSAAPPAKDTHPSKLRQALDRKTRFDFIDTSLVDAIQLLREFNGNNEINFVIDEGALDDAGIDQESAITLELTDVKLRTALQLMLKPLDLTYVETGDKVLLITSIEEAETMLTTTVYPVHDLLNKDEPNLSAENLIETIVCSTTPDSWEEVGGTGSINFFQGNLIVSQTHQAHEAVADLLDKIRAGVKLVGGPIYPEESRDHFAPGGGGFGGGAGKATAGNAAQSGGVF